MMSLKEVNEKFLVFLEAIEIKIRLYWLMTINGSVLVECIYKIRLQFYDTAK